jgi:NAD(P)-dependent dehydrogenase (short-subunit alcohol dehydrogenase family)
VLTPLESRVAVVSGGSRGIGRGIATALARHGARVLIAARGEEEAAATAAAISADGGAARHAVADLSLPEGADELARAAPEAFGGVDILCCNAGVFPNVPLRDMTPADLDLVLQTNLRGLERDPFVDRLTYYLGEINALHPFREGNGRAQRAFAGQVARQAGYVLRWDGLDPEQNVHASQAIMREDPGPMRTLLAPRVEPLRIEIPACSACWYSHRSPW